LRVAIVRPLYLALRIFRFMSLTALRSAILSWWAFFLALAFAAASLSARVFITCSL
jgi:hypothetical protein